MNDLTIIPVKGTAVAARRDNSPIVSNGRIGKAIAVATNDLIETYRTPNMTPEQAGATMRSYLRVMDGHSEAVVERALNELIVNNPAGRWLPGPVDLRDAIDRVEWAPLHEFWRKLTPRLNMVAADVREALRGELFDAIRGWLGDHGMEPADDEWARFIALAETARTTNRDGVLVQAKWWAYEFKLIVAARMLNDAMDAARVAVRPGIEAEFAKYRAAIEALSAHARRREAVKHARNEAKSRYEEEFEALVDKWFELPAGDFQRKLDALPIAPDEFDEPEPAVPDVEIVRRFRGMAGCLPDDDAKTIVGALVESAAREQVPPSLRLDLNPYRRPSEENSRCGYQYGAAGERARSTPEIDRKLGLDSGDGVDR